MMLGVTKYVPLDRMKGYYVSLCCVYPQFSKCVVHITRQKFIVEQKFEDPVECRRLFQYQLLSSIIILFNMMHANISPFILLKTQARTDIQTIAKYVWRTANSRLTSFLALFYAFLIFFSLIILRIRKCFNKCCSFWINLISKIITFSVSYAIHHKQILRSCIQKNSVE